MKKSEVKELLKLGKCQIYNDVSVKLDWLREITKGSCVRSGKYYFLDSCSEYPYQIMKIINLSDITEDEDMVWKGSDMEWSYDFENIWKECNTQVKFRLKPKPNNDKEIAELLERLEKLGYKL